MANSRTNPYPGLHIRKDTGKWYISKRVNGNHIRINTRTTNKRDAILCYHAHAEKWSYDTEFKNILGGVNTKSDWYRFVNSNIGSTWIKKYINSASNRKSVPSHLTFEDIRLLAIRSNGECELSGIPFSYGKEKTQHRSPYAPSLDRIDSGGNYTFNNCRFVCTAVNIGLNEGGDEVFINICKNVAKIKFYDASATREK